MHFFAGLPPSLAVLLASSLLANHVQAGSHIPRWTHLRSKSTSTHGYGARAGSESGSGGKYSPKKNLIVTMGSTSISEPGGQCTWDDVSSAPTIQFPAADESKTYTAMAMELSVNPDSLDPTEIISSSNNYLSYIQPGLTARSSNNPVLTSETNPLVPFQMTGRGGDQPQMLVIQLFVQPHPLVIGDSYKLAFSGMQADDSKRDGFDFKAFCDSAGLTNMQASTWVIVNGTTAAGGKGGQEGSRKADLDADDCGCNDEDNDHDGGSSTSATTTATRPTIALPTLLPTLLPTTVPLPDDDDDITSCEAGMTATVTITATVTRDGNQLPPSSISSSAGGGGGGWDWLTGLPDLPATTALPDDDGGDYGTGIATTATTTRGVWPWPTGGGEEGDDDDDCGLLCDGTATPTATGLWPWPTGGGEGDGEEGGDNDSDCGYFCDGTTTATATATGLWPWPTGGGEGGGEGGDEDDDCGLLCDGTATPTATGLWPWPTGGGEGDGEGDEGGDGECGYLCDGTTTDTPTATGLWPWPTGDGEGNGEGGEEGDGGCGLLCDDTATTTTATGLWPWPTGGGGEDGGEDGGDGEVGDGCDIFGNCSGGCTGADGEDCSGDDTGATTTTPYVPAPTTFITSEIATTTERTTVTKLTAVYPITDCTKKFGCGAPTGTGILPTGTGTAPWPTTTVPVVIGGASKDTPSRAFMATLLGGATLISFVFF